MDSHEMRLCADCREPHFIENMERTDDGGHVCQHCKSDRDEEAKEATATDPA